MTGYKNTKTSAGLVTALTELVQARKDRNMSQSALGERLGVTQVCISRWENATNAVSLADATRWAAALGLEIHASEPRLPDGPPPELFAGGLG